MKKAIKRIAQKSNRKLQEIMGRMEVNLILPIAEILVATRWHIEQLAGAAPGVTPMFRFMRLSRRPQCLPDFPVMYSGTPNSFREFIYIKKRFLMRTERPLFCEQGAL